MRIRFCSRSSSFKCCVHLRCISITANDDGRRIVSEVGDNADPSPLPFDTLSFPITARSPSIVFSVACRSARAMAWGVFPSWYRSLAVFKSVYVALLTMTMMSMQGPSASGSSSEEREEGHLKRTSSARKEDSCAHVMMVFRSAPNCLIVSRNSLWSPFADASSQEDGTARQDHLPFHGR